MRISVLLTLLLAYLSWSAKALPRLQTLGFSRDALSGSAEMVDADQLVLPEPPEYKNSKPLIGILSQACHYCPGK